MPFHFHDFDAAYSYFQDRYLEGSVFWSYVGAKISDIRDEADIGHWKDALYAASYAILNNRNALNSLTNYDEGIVYKSPLMMCLKFAAVEPESEALTMDSLLSTMLTATPEQLQYFVGLVDAYRQSLWNRPFNAEFYAALARGFEQWP